MLGDSQKVLCILEEEVVRDNLNNREVEVQSDNLVVVGEDRVDVVVGNRRKKVVVDEVVCVFALQVVVVVVPLHVSPTLTHQYDDFDHLVFYVEEEYQRHLEV